MSKIEKYLTEGNPENKNVKELVKLSKAFITDMKIISGKHDFQSIEGVTKNFLDMYIRNLTKISGKLKYNE